MKKTIFEIPKMDCPSEERLIRMKLDGVSEIKQLSFNIPERQLTVSHEGDADKVLQKLIPLNFGARIRETLESSEVLAEELDPVSEAKVLKWLLAINGTMFIVEMVLGLYSDSMGLVSDSVDMLADALVYGLSLFAVGKALSAKKHAAKVSGYFQLLLALGVCFEAIRRFIYGSDPQSSFMIGVSIVALIANVSCLFILFKHKNGEVHMKASWIFSANDVIANAGVICAGILVMVTGSSLPDLIISLIVSGIVARGAFSILSLSK